MTSVGPTGKFSSFVLVHKKQEVREGVSFAEWLRKETQADRGLSACVLASPLCYYTMQPHQIAQFSLLLQDGVKMTCFVANLVPTYCISSVIAPIYF